MIRSNKRKFLRLKAMIKELSAHPEHFSLLWDLQMDLLGNIRHVEALAKAARQRSGTRKDRKDSYRHLLYIYRAFGDAIACTYMSSWNLKQLSYDLDSGDLRHSPGYISEKAGLDLEIDVLRVLIDKKVPAVLADLTNSIRYGDVCLLAGDDPFIIECKSGRSRNQRVRRQEEVYRALSTFYKNDRKSMRHGLIEVKRELLEAKEVSYVDELNELLELASRTGYCTRQVEPGVIYIASTNNAAIEELDLPKMRNPWIFCLNGYKNDSTWISYRPFTLLIHDQDNLNRFIFDDLQIVVILDVAKVHSIASRIGLRFEANESLQYPFCFYKMDKTSKKAKYMFSLSTHIITRVALECLSLRWLIENNHRLFLSSRSIGGSA